MKALAQFLKSEGWLAETSGAFALTIGLISGRGSNGGIIGKLFHYLIRWCAQIGFNPNDDTSFFWIVFICNFILSATIFYIYRAEIIRIMCLITFALKQLPEANRYTTLHSLLVTSTFAAVFSIIAAIGGTLGEWISDAAIAISGGKEFYFMRVPVCFCLSYPFCQCAMATNKMASVLKNYYK